MITSKLKFLFAISIPLFIAHGIEEILTGFYNLDQWDEWIFGLLPFSSTPQAMFATFQVMIWVLFVVALLMLLNERIRLYTLGLVGVIYLFELHHPIKAIISEGYYPGLVTSLIFPFFAFFFWKEWMINHKKIK